MYKNLEAELARKGATRTQLSEYLGISLGTLSLKLNGKATLTFPEAERIKQFLGVNMTLDELFTETA